MPFRAALSGLNASSSELRVIGNNVANASTVGFKKSRAEFADVYAISALGIASNAIGSGVRVSNVSQQFTQGNVEFTDNNLDLAINGRGFFVLTDGGSQIFSRAGTFSVDRDGYIVNPQAQRLQTFQADSAGNITGAIGDLQLDTSDIAPQQTSLVTLDINVDSRDSVPVNAFAPTDPSSYNSSTSLNVYDSLGNPLLATMYYRKAAVNSWNVYTYITEPNGTSTALTPSAGANPPVLTFNSTGDLTAVSSPGATPLAMDYNALVLTTGAANLVMDTDYSGATQYGSTFSVNALTQDGYSSGRLNGVDIDESGVILARYTNGQSQTLGQVALADFANAQGLRQLGDTNWAESFGSGAAVIGSPGSSSLGLITSGAVEGSNVNLTEQLVQMITAQRNFQANAQVISTADTVTQTIINIR